MSAGLYFAWHKSTLRNKHKDGVIGYKSNLCPAAPGEQYRS